MKRKTTKTLLLAIVVMLLTISIQPSMIQAADLELEAETAILVDFETGKILYAKDADVALPPASMTKVMTEYLVLEAIDSGQITWETTTKISDYAYEISAPNNGFSGIGLRQDREYTVRELYERMAIISDNATTIALAELIAGSEGEFVKLMNQKAEELGLPEAEFVNSSGLDNVHLGDNYPEGTDPEGVNLLSARSMALLAYHLIKDYPHALEISSQLSVEAEGEVTENLNWMLPHDSVNLEQYYYEGIDGLKTGYTELAENTFTGTATQNGKRLISVVMKAGEYAEKGLRFEETAKLMDYGFNKFQTTELFQKGYQLEDQATLPVAKGKEDSVNISLSEGITVPILAEEADSYHLEYQIDEDRLNEDGELIAPVKQGDIIGTATLVYEGGDDYGYIIPSNNSIDLIAEDTVEKANWFMLTLGAIGDFFANVFTTAVDWIKGLFS
ncbi:serine hydrolase [Oceanobacillus bengalensis]|uniref:serine-type D-Ala-D-Ala carboxypeptidase n=1 Tax=Oceanobacillus bengalensis TaxID=1435466 RepID=A0A494YZ09_9BACI|nr:serine hydrolase [Oceanobacillus bengalensis]RKQ15244.1 D-alanyl-D-alanine carboxypeptidase [Oceanobacillus bengalensis]